MRPAQAPLAAALAAALVAGACARIDDPSALGEPAAAPPPRAAAPGPMPAPASVAGASAPISPASTSPTTDRRLLQALSGQWHQQAKEEIRRNALVANVVLVLSPDGRLNLFRDDSGGTNFAFQSWGLWTASSPTPGVAEVALTYVGARPGRMCYTLTGGCQDFPVPVRETFIFTLTGPDTMETPGGLWRRSRLS